MNSIIGGSNGSPEPYQDNATTVKPQMNGGYESSDDEMNITISETPLPGIDPAFRAAVLKFKNGLYEAEMFKGQNDSAASQATNVLGRYVKLLHLVHCVLNDRCAVAQLPLTIHTEVEALKAPYRANARNPAYRQYLENNFITYPYKMNDNFRD